MQVLEVIMQVGMQYTLFLYKKLFYKKESLIFTEKLKNPETFAAQMKIPNKKVRNKLPKLSLTTLFFGKNKTHFLLSDRIWLKFLIF